jgi:flagellar hook-associated protein 1 FlgK
MAHSQSINTAGHNISNEQTEGYSRQRVEIRAFDPIYRPDLSRAETPGQIGQGSFVQSISRLRDGLLDKQIAAETNMENYWGARDKYYVMFENIYNEPADVSVRTNMDKFWDGWQELSLYPESKAARQAVVTRGESLINAIQQRNKGLNGIGELLDGDVTATVRQVNSYTKQIAELSGQIVRVRAMGDNPNDLLDRRDLLTEKLSGLINITVDERDPDEYIVQTAGNILVQGSIATPLDVRPRIDDNGYHQVVWGNTGADAHFSGGTLGALVELRDVDLREEMQNLNTMTMNFTDLVNDVHRNAVGANGVTGLDFFTEHPFVNNVAGNYDRNGDGTVDTSYIFRITGANVLSPQEQIGVSGTVTISGTSGNVEVPYYSSDTVEMVVQRINNSNGEVKAYLDRNSRMVLKASTAADRNNPDFVIRHIEDSGRFLTGYAGVLQGSGPENAYDFDRPDAVASLVQPAGTESGALYAVAPLTNPSAYMEINPAIRTDVLSVAAAFISDSGVAESGDGSAALAIASIRNTQVMIGHNRTFDDYFADTVTNVGLKGEQASINFESRIAMMEDLRTLRASISGVNIDEELADIIKFQHGYNAAAKFVSVMDELLDTVINRLKV